jgi:integral membrane protein
VSGRRSFRGSSLAEGMSLLALLFVAMPLKYGLGLVMAVRVAGGLHGVLFLALLSTAMRALLDKSLPKADIARVLGLALLPFGFVIADRILRGPGDGGA